MKTYLCRHGLMLWLELRGRRVMPDHEDLDPYRLAPVLASRFILDVAPDAICAVEIGTRVRARLPAFTQAPRAAFANMEGAAFDEIVHIVADEGHGAVLGARHSDVVVEILLMPLSLHRFFGRRVLGVIADCNPYAKPGATGPLKIESCRFLSKDLHDSLQHSAHFQHDENAPLTAPEHSRRAALTAERQILTPKFHSRLLQ